MQSKIEEKILEKKEQISKIFSKELHLKRYYKNIALNSLILSKKDYLKIKSDSENIIKILEKTVKLYFSEKKVRDFFDFSEKQKKIIQNYYPKNKSLYLARFDGFLTNNKIKFLEFNVNFPGGIDRLDKISEKLFNFYKQNNIKKIKNFNNIQNNFIQMVIKLYNKTPKFFLAIVYGEKTEPQNIKSMNAIADILKKNKIKTIVCHWKDLIQKKEKIYYKNKEINLIFRTALLQRIWQYDYKYAKKVFNAMNLENISMFNMPQAYICGVKDLFALWHEKWFLKYFEKEEKKLIKKCIPKTYKMSNNILKKQNIIKNKDKWVIKPIEGIGGKAVFVGKSINNKKWNEIVEKHFGSKRWIIQEFIQTEQYKILNLNTENETINTIKTYLNVSPWLIDSKLSGISIRYSKKLVINVAKGGGIMTTFVY